MSGKNNSVTAEDPDLPKSLVAQYRFILSVNKNFNHHLPLQIRRDDSHYDFLYTFFSSFFVDRIRRSREIKSERYRIYIEKMTANTLEGMPFILVRCVDGRDIPIHEGFTAGSADTYRVAGGDPAGFMRNASGALELDIESDFLAMIKKAVLNSKSKVISIIWGAHLKCSAAEKKQNDRQGPVEDKGILQAIIDRKEMIEATKTRLREDKRLQDKIFIFSQDIFNVDNGHSYWNVASDEALLIGRKKGGYTQNVLDELADEGKIISTKHIVQATDTILNIFMKQTITTDNKGHADIFRLDWEDNYVSCAEKLNEKISAMKKELLPVIASYIQVYHPHIGKDELFAKALPILMSAYIGFVNNLPSPHIHTEFTKITLKAMQDGRYYRYKKHDEEGIKASIGTYPPYKHQMFAVFIGEDLAKNVKIAQRIIRNNRAEGKLDASNIITDKIEFASAPIPFVIKEIVLEVIKEEDWQEYQNLDFSDLVKESWDTWSLQQHIEYLHEKGITMSQIIAFIKSKKTPWDDEELLSVMKVVNLKLPLIIQAMEKLRNYMKSLYKDGVIARYLVENQLVALPVISDQGREPRLVVPYIKFGRKLE